MKKLLFFTLILLVSSAAIAGDDAEHAVTITANNPDAVKVDSDVQFGVINFSSAQREGDMYVIPALNTFNLTSNAVYKIQMKITNSSFGKGAKVRLADGNFKALNTGYVDVVDSSGKSNANLAIGINADSANSAQKDSEETLTIKILPGM